MARHYTLEQNLDITKVNLDSEAQKKIEALRDIYFQKFFQKKWRERHTNSPRVVLLAQEFISWLMPELTQLHQEVSTESGQEIVFRLIYDEERKLVFHLRLRLSEDPAVIYLVAREQFSVIGCTYYAAYDILKRYYSAKPPSPDLAISPLYGSRLLPGGESRIINYAVNVYPPMDLPRFLSHLAHFLTKTDPKILEELEKLHQQFQNNPPDDIVRRYNDQVDLLARTFQPPS